jgi:hypothetical protein
MYRSLNSLDPFNPIKELKEVDNNGAMERHKINMKKNHKILEEEDKIIKMKKLRNENRQFL